MSRTSTPEKGPTDSQEATLPFPSQPSAEARIAALEAQLAALRAKVNAPTHEEVEAQRVRDRILEESQFAERIRRATFERVEQEAQRERDRVAVRPRVPDEAVLRSFLTQLETLIKNSYSRCSRVADQEIAMWGWFEPLIDVFLQFYQRSHVVVGWPRRVREGLDEIANLLRGLALSWGWLDLLVGPESRLMLVTVKLERWKRVSEFRPMQLAELWCRLYDLGVTRELPSPRAQSRALEARARGIILLEIEPEHLGIVHDSRGWPRDQVKVDNLYMRANDEAYIVPALGNGRDSGVLDPANRENLLAAMSPIQDALQYEEACHGSAAAS